MNDSTVANDLREYCKHELRFLPVAAAIVIAVGLVVWIYRLDQIGNPFPMGIMIGALLSIPCYGCVTAINLGAILSGAPKQSSLLRKLLWLTRARASQ